MQADRQDVNRLLVVLAGVAAMLAAMGGARPASPEPFSERKKGARPATEPTGGTSDSGAYLQLNQRWIEGLRAGNLDVEDVDAVFWAVFSRLPNAVTVYPTENYYYWQLHVAGHQIWGNIQLPADRRDRGVLRFAYSEFNEFPGVEPRTGLRRWKSYTTADELTIAKRDRFTYVVGYRGKSVTFRLTHVPQNPPKLFSLGPDEVFVERTLDESGYQFFLLFNERGKYFVWVLNEEPGVPDTLKSVQDDLLVGRRSGFAFWVDAAHDNRKILAAVRRLSARRNDYYDGPFDQLADNYADEVRVSDFMVRADPALRGRIDKYGHYTDREGRMRVALSTYYAYTNQSDLLEFLKRAKASDDPYRLISRSFRRGESQ